MRPEEALGDLGGWLLSPVTGVLAAARRSRMFHPDGIVLAASVQPHPACEELAELAERLSGPALVRLSSAWWKHEKEWPDDLGLALRFSRSEVPSVEPARGDQDLLFATIRSPWTTLPAVLTTHVHDFLANDYYAVSPFRVRGIDARVKWRLVSQRPESRGSTRLERLLDALRTGQARFRLQIKLRRQPYADVALLTLLHPVQLEQRRLRFDPFREGRGIAPVGFVQMLRKGAYAGSQRTRAHVHQTEQSAL